MAQFDATPTSPWLPELEEWWHLKKGSTSVFRSECHSCFNCPSLNKVEPQALFVNLSGRSLLDWKNGLQTGSSLGVSSSLAVKFHSLWGQRCGVGMPWASPTWMLLRSTRPGIPNGTSPVRSGALDCYRWNHWGLGIVAPSPRKSQQKRKIWTWSPGNTWDLEGWDPSKHDACQKLSLTCKACQPGLETTSNRSIAGLWVSKRPSWFGELLHWLGIICTGNGGCSPLRDQTKNAVIAAEHPWPRHDEEPFLH